MGGMVRETVYDTRPRVSRPVLQSTYDLRGGASRRLPMDRVTQAHCGQIAAALNHRPRKRLDFLTPAEIYEDQR